MKRSARAGLVVPTLKRASGASRRCRGSPESSSNLPRAVLTHASVGSAAGSRLGVGSVNFRATPRCCATCWPRLAGAPAAVRTCATSCGSRSSSSRGLRGAAGGCVDYGLSRLKRHARDVRCSPVGAKTYAGQMLGCYSAAGPTQTRPGCQLRLVCGAMKRILRHRRRAGFIGSAFVHLHAGSRTPATRSSTSTRWNLRRQPDNVRGLREVTASSTATSATPAPSTPRWPAATPWSTSPPRPARSTARCRTRALIQTDVTAFCRRGRAASRHRALPPLDRWSTARTANNPLAGGR